MRNRTKNRQIRKENRQYHKNTVMTNTEYKRSPQIYDSSSNLSAVENIENNMFNTVAPQLIPKDLLKLVRSNI